MILLSVGFVIGMVVTLIAIYVFDNDDNNDGF